MKWDTFVKQAKVKQSIKRLDAKIDERLQELDEERKAGRYIISRYGHRKWEVQDLQTKTSDKVLVGIYESFEEARNAIWKKEENEFKREV